jgi:membrane-associated phospholipid phosphatase
MALASLLFARASIAYNPLDHLWQGTRDMPRSENAWILAIGGSAALVAGLTLDDDFRSYFAGKRRLGYLEEVGFHWGWGIPGLTIGAGSWAYGAYADSPRELNAGQAHLEAYGANTAYTQILKYSVRRMRPNGLARVSFPSGHTSTAFVTAGNLMAFYGPTLGVPALIMGLITALSRISADKHWLSDTIAGATLGYIVGHSYTIHHREETEPALAVIPYFEDRSNFGLLLHTSF